MQLANHIANKISKSKNFGAPLLQNWWNMLIEKYLKSISKRKFSLSPHQAFLFPAFYIFSFSYAFYTTSTQDLVWWFENSVIRRYWEWIVFLKILPKIKHRKPFCRFFFFLSLLRLYSSNSMQLAWFLHWYNTSHPSDVEDHARQLAGKILQLLNWNTTVLLFLLAHEQYVVILTSCQSRGTNLLNSRHCQSQRSSCTDPCPQWTNVSPSFLKSKILPAKNYSMVKSLLEALSSAAIHNLACEFSSLSYWNMFLPMNKQFAGATRR